MSSTDARRVCRIPRAFAVPVVLLLLAASLAAAGEATVFSGFVDASGSSDLTTRTGTFGLDQGEIDVTRAVNERCTVRADMEWVKDGQTWAQDLEQGFLTYRFGGRRGPTATLGRFNAPMGFELLDPVDMYQFSHALVFEYGLPTNLTGLRLDQPLDDRLRVSGWWVDGWDRNDTADRPRTYGGRLDLDAGSGRHVGVSVITGKQWQRSGLAPGDAGWFAPYRLQRTVVDLDVSLAPRPGLLCGGEFNYGRRRQAGVTHAWAGALVMTHVDVNSWWGWTSRWGWFSDHSGWILGSAGPQVRTAATLAATFVLGDGAGALVEVRYDHANRDVWVDDGGTPTDHHVTAAFETTYSF